MKITLLDANTLRLTFPFSITAKTFVASLVGSEYEGKAKRTWAVPLCYLRTLLTQFPSATVEDAATVIEARYELWRTWLRNHNRSGIYFALSPADAATVIAYRDDGEPVSDVLQAHVAKRSPQLREWLHVQRFPVASHPLPNRPSVWETVEPTDGVRLVWNGIQNAAKAAERKEEVIERVKGKRRKAKVVQASLIGDPDA